MTSVENKREREKRLVTQMITLYCHRKHGTKGILCPECQKLDTYVRQRSDACPFMESKTFCSSCTVHCYKKDMKERIREVMRFSGPRMMAYHPILVIHHVIDNSKNKRKV